MLFQVGGQGTRPTFFEMSAAQQLPSSLRAALTYSLGVSLPLYSFTLMGFLISYQLFHYFRYYYYFCNLGVGGWGWGWGRGRG